MAQKGFTLVEMVVVLALLSIGCLGIGYSVQWVQRVRFEACVAEVTQYVTQAQMRAALQNKRYDVETRTIGGKQVVRIIANTETQEITQLPADISVSCNTDKISFNGDLSPAQAGTVSLTSTPLKRRVELRIRPVTGELARYDFEI